MNRILKYTILPILLISQTLCASTRECLEAANYEMNALHHPGQGCEDGIYNAVSSSMLGWGIGLFAGIALLTGLVHNSHQESSSSSSSSSN